MTRKERVKYALAHKQTDITPYNVELTIDETARFTALTGVAPSEYSEFVGNHMEKAVCGSGSYINDNFYKDEFGVVWDRTTDKDIGMPDKYVLQSDSFDGYKFPEPDLAAVKARVKKLAESKTDCFKIAKVGMVLYERAWSMRGMENLMTDMYDNEDFVSALMSAITDYQLKIINAALKYNIDGVYFGDDYGSQIGLMFSDKLWRKFIKPNLARLFAPIKEKNRRVLFHSCGNISLILDDMVEIGLDCYQTVQPEVYNLKELKKRYAGKLAFWGAISTQQFLSTAKPAEVAPKIKETIAILGKNGGYICAPTHQVPGDVPPENIAAMLEYLKNQK